MKRILSSIVLLCFCLCISAQQQVLHSAYDTNGDGKVTLADLTALIGKLNGKVKDDALHLTSVKIDTIHYQFHVTDTIHDTIHNIVYVTDTIPQPKTYTISGVEYPMPEAVDLGLPSGTLWASLNVGSKNIHDKGFDDVLVYDEELDDKEYIDNLLSHASIKGWELPSPEQINELKKYCSFIVEYNDGTKIDPQSDSWDFSKLIYKVVGKNKNFIYIPFECVYHPDESDVCYCLYSTNKFMTSALFYWFECESYFSVKLEQELLPIIDKQYHRLVKTK